MDKWLNNFGFVPQPGNKYPPKPPGGQRTAVFRVRNCKCQKSQQVFFSTRLRGRGVGFDGRPNLLESCPQANFPPV